MLVFCYPCMHGLSVSTWGADFFLVTLMLVPISSKKVPMEIFHISFESTQNKHNMLLK